MISYFESVMFHVDSMLGASNCQIQISPNQIQTVPNVTHQNSIFLLKHLSPERTNYGYII